MVPHWDQPNIEPISGLSITFYYVSTKMATAEACPNNQIEPLSGDPLSGFDCTSPDETQIDATHK